jgi:hypothetical protein
MLDHRVHASGSATKPYQRSGPALAAVRQCRGSPCLRLVGDSNGLRTQTHGAEKQASGHARCQASKRQSDEEEHARAFRRLLFCRTAKMCRTLPSTTTSDGGDDTRAVADVSGARVAKGAPHAPHAVEAGGATGVRERSLRPWMC